MLFETFMFAYSAVLDNIHYTHHFCFLYINSELYCRQTAGNKFFDVHYFLKRSTYAVLFA